MTDNQTMRDLLNAFDFDRLFVEHLGWDRHGGELSVDVAGESYLLNGLAQKRGVQILECRAADGDQVPDYISGFHSPMEKECLAILLRSPHPVIMCPARGLGNMRIRQEWKQPLADGRLLLLSPFPPDMRRGTAADAIFRNRFVAALADEILIAHASSEGKIARLVDEVTDWGKKISSICPVGLRLTNAGGPDCAD